jgi:ABC-type bacteriocin/lantibiotic exporter with double-glycine peptidase domain
MMTSEQAASVEKGSDLELQQGEESHSQTLVELSEENQILDCLQYLLRCHGIEKSIASIREIAEVSDGDFGFSNAVSALRNLDFSANVGVMSSTKLNRGHCPSIIKYKDGTIAVLVEVTPEKEYQVYQPNNEENFVNFSKKKFNDVFSKSTLLAKSPRQEDNEKQKKNRLVLGFSFTK